MIRRCPLHGSRNGAVFGSMQSHPNNARTSRESHASMRAPRRGASPPTRGAFDDAGTAAHPRGSAPTVRSSPAPTLAPHTSLLGRRLLRHPAIAGSHLSPFSAGLTTRHKNAADAAKPTPMRGGHLKKGNTRHTPILGRFRPVEADGRSLPTHPLSSFPVAGLRIAR